MQPQRRLDVQPSFIADCRHRETIVVLNQRGKGPVYQTTPPKSIKIEGEKKTKQKKNLCGLLTEEPRGGERKRFSHLAHHYRGGTGPSLLFVSFFLLISMWKGWRPAEHSWLWEDPGTIPLHAHANHPQQPRRRRGQTERLQHSDLPVRP